MKRNEHDMPRESARRLRLLLRDGAAGAAFAAMALSGQMPLWVCALFVAGWVLALAGKRPFAMAASVSIALLSVAAVGFGALFFFGRMDLVIAASSFAGLLTLQRMLASAEPRTDQQVHLASLLMLAGGAALSGDMLFGFTLLVFTLLGSLSLGLGVVEAAVPEGEPVPVRAVVGPLSRGVAFALIGALAFFVFFPRMSWNVATRNGSSNLGAATTGFTDRVRLGDGQGTLKTNPRVVARVTLKPEPKVDSLDRYWIGRAFDAFDGSEWSVSEKRRDSELSIGSIAGVPRDARVQQRIELLPAYDGRTLVALEPVVMLLHPRVQTPTGPQPTRFERLGGEEVRFADSGAGYLFEAVSVTDASLLTPAELSSVEHAQLLALPEALDRRVKALADEVLQTESSPLEAARKLEAYLKRTYTYSLELEGGVDDPLAHFLFERKEGHCEHFATALTVLLRSRGIPARLASGFYGGERVGDHFVIRAGDAHAWTQVFVPGRGWITVDATPESFRQSQPIALFALAVGVYEWLEQRWLSNVVDYTLRDQVDGVRSLVRPAKQGRDPFSASDRLPPLRAWLVAAIAALGVYATWRFGQRRHHRERPGPATRLHDQLRQKLCDAALVEPDEGSLEAAAQRLREAHHPIAPALDTVTRRYLSARFGGQPLEPDEARHLLATLDRALRQHAPGGGRARKS